MSPSSRGYSAIMKKYVIYSLWFILFLFLVAGGVLGARLFFGGDEDTWLCQNGQWIKHGQPSAPQPTSGCGIVTTDTPTPTPSTVGINFVKTGSLVKNSPGMETDRWYLVFEEAGQPALNAILIFDEQSLCDGVKCQTDKFVAGQSVKISGVKDENSKTVLIKKLEVVQSAQMANPASVYCENHGGALQIREAANGQVGICVFADNSECEEWAYMRGECKIGDSIKN